MSVGKGAERPATFGEVLASPEYRALYGASICSWLGDYLAKAAVTALVYQQTGSAVASAGTFAISFLPWIAGGPVLAALAERYPYRRIMIISDASRMALIACVAIPGLPIPAMLGLLFFTALLNPPFDAARSALLPRILSGDRYVVALSLQTSTNQVAQLAGYLAGSALAGLDPRLALLIDAGTFGLSALVIGLAVAPRPPLLRPEQREHLLRETARGFRVVFGSRALRSIAMVVLVVNLFSSPPEGLAASWAGELDSGMARRGFDQGMIMMAAPFGFFVGSLVIGRLIAPATRQRLIRPFSILAPVTLIPALADPGVYLAAGLAAACGACVAGLLPPSNGLFVQALRREYRARAFGIMQSGLQIVQGLGVLVVGVIADRYAVHTVIGAWSVVGAIAMIAIGTTWPARDTFTTAIDDAARANAAAEAAEAGSPPRPPAARTPDTGPSPAAGVEPASM